MKILDAVTLDDLPGKVRIELPEAPENGALQLFQVIGYVLAGIGILTVFFGPSHIMVDRVSGPTLFQFFQLYPGPIASVGFMIATMCQRSITSEQNEFVERTNKVTEEAIQINDEDIPSGYKLAFAPCENQPGVLNVSLEELPEFEEAEVEAGSVV